MTQVLQKLFGSPTDEARFKELRTKLALTPDRLSKSEEADLARIVGLLGVSKADLERDVSALARAAQIRKELAKPPAEPASLKPADELKGLDSVALESEINRLQRLLARLIEHERAVGFYRMDEAANARRYRSELRAELQELEANNPELFNL